MLDNIVLRVYSNVGNYLERDICAVIGVWITIYMQINATKNKKVKNQISKTIINLSKRKLKQVSAFEN